MPSSLRICPYCGSEFRLETAPVAATHGDGDAFTTTNDDMSLTDNDFGTSEGDTATGTVSPHSSRPNILWTPPEPSGQTRKSVLTQLLGSTPSLKQLHDFKTESMARRVCPQCLRPLPVDIDDRQLHLLAIAGLNHVGKTHFLAAAMTEATRRQGLRQLGWREFQPDVETASRFHRDYFVPLFREGRILEGTQVDDQVRFQPLTFRATLDGRPPMLIMTHDIAGEALADHRLRAKDAPFLRRASAVIFLVDPTEFDAIYVELPGYERESMRARSIDQVDLLAACIRELQFAPGGQDVPVAVVVAKADILSAVLGRTFSFDREGSRGDSWVSDIQQTSQEVEQLLIQLGEHNLVETARAHDRVTFHAVSPLGSSPNAGQFRGARPVRCIEPLAAVLIRLAHALN